VSDSTPRHPARADPAAVARLANDLPDLDWISDASRVARLSQDF